MIVRVAVAVDHEVLEVRDVDHPELAQLRLVGVQALLEISLV
jgi:hypothetical protein